jgi:hypothetical protein
VGLQFGSGSGQPTLYFQVVSTYTRIQPLPIAPAVHPTRRARWPSPQPTLAFGDGLLLVVWWELVAGCVHAATC